MNIKEEALKLADEILLCTTDPLHSKTSAMIRRLVEELDKLNGCLIAEQEHNEMLQTKPLSDEEIEQLAKRKANQILMDLLMPDVGEPKKIDWNIGCTNQHLINFARAIEERHGIK